METPTQNPAPKNGRRIIIVVVVLAVAYFIFSSLPFISPFIFSSRSDKKSDENFEKIMKMIEPAQERDYQFFEPSPEAQKRTISCKNLSMFQSDLPIINPLCLNLYKTNAAEINEILAKNDNKYDRVILYGEKIIWDAPIWKKTGDDNFDFGKALVDSAKFNDQITIPKMMKLYGFSDLSFVNKLTPNKIFPFSALYFRLSGEEEVKKACQKGEYENAPVAGCALGMWSSVIPSYILGEKMSLANQKIWRISDEKERDYIAYDYKWPKNCYAEETMLHETAHLFLNAHRAYNIADTLVAPKYFNEHQADMVKIMATDLVCGKGSVTNFRDNNGKETRLSQFNAIYPPGKMGSAWPKADERCKLGLLNEWNRFLAKGEFDAQFTAFTNAFKDWMKEGKTISDDKGLANFLIKLNNDEDSKTNLQYRGCYF